MKYHYREMPESLDGTYAAVSKAWGFDWKEFVMGVPAPLFLVTGYKPNGKPNASLQSWAGFTSAGRGSGYYAVLGSVNKGGHLYESLKDTGVAVLNFMSADLYGACMETVKNNQYEADEITASGLTAEEASWVRAPMVAECFMNLECRYLWEKEIVPGDDHVMICLEVLGGHVDRDFLEDRFGEKGILYYVHYPMDPGNVKEKGCDFVAALKEAGRSSEY